MIDISTFTFLHDLKENNYREWFHEHRPEYEKARENVVESAGKLLTEINKFDNSLGFPDPKRCIFRIARDTRFSLNKEPYKINFGIALNKGGKTMSRYSCYYVHIEPGKCLLSCGIYMPQPEALKNIREAIDYAPEELISILENPLFKKEFGDLSFEDAPLKRVPLGFDKNSPAAEYLKLKHFYVSKPVKDEFLQHKDFEKRAAALFEITYPLNNHLNNIIENI